MNIREEIASLAQPIDQFHTHPRNVRQGDVGAISESLKSHGQYRPIVVQRSTGYVLAGNHTFMAAKSLGWKQVAVTYVDCDNEQAMKILLVDNRANDLAMYDDRALADLLKELAATEAGLDGSLFSGDDLDDLLYRLEGTMGNAEAGKTWGEGMDDYFAKDTRTLLFPMTVAEYEDVSRKLKELREEAGEENNSVTLIRLVEEAYAQLGSDA
jgi:hypothetical protein